VIQVLAYRYLYVNEITYYMYVIELSIYLEKVYSQFHLQIFKYDLVSFEI
jgi:hypothetical protein